MKIVTYMDNIRHAEPHTGVSNSSYAGDVDHQMTYYTSSGEFVFEFGLDRCGAAAQALGYTGGGVYSVPGTDGQGNCFFDIDAYSNFGEDSRTLGYQLGRSCQQLFPRRKRMYWHSN